MHQHRSRGSRSPRTALWAVLFAITLASCGGEDSDTTVAEVGAGSQDPPPAANSPPVINATPATETVAGTSYTYDPDATDADNDTLTYEVTNLPRWATFNTTTGAISGTPTDSDVGEALDIEISVSDGEATTIAGPFGITVAARPATPPPSPSPPPPGPSPPANTAPTISGTPATTATVGQAYAFQPSAADANNDTLRFSISGRPSWATFSTSTGRLAGTPASSNVGTFSSIRISVSDGKTSVPLPMFSIQVRPPANRAPVLAGTPATTGTVGTAYSFQPTASDADNDTLTFSITNKPAWATFNTSNGRLSGTPTAAQTYSGIRISVSDTKTNVSMPEFSIQVQAAPNRPPVISGTAASSVNVGTSYSFTPTASDPDNDTLTFSITNKPTWAAFNTQTGRLSGTPTTAGTTSNIQISVTDNKISTPIALASFSIAVIAAPPPPPPATGSVTLDWTPPTANSDGSTLTNLAGYRILYGTSAGSLTRTIQVTNPSVSSYVVEGLTSATWYFSIKSYTSAGVESTPSNPVSRTIP